MSAQINTDEYQYLNLLKDVLENGKGKMDRTGTGTISVFGRQIRFDLRRGFPLMTTKKMFTRGIIVELLWFLQGSGNIKYLVDNNVHIWDEWPYKYYTLNSKDKPLLTQPEFIEKLKTDGEFAEIWGELGPAYGVQWRKWKKPAGGEVDQIGGVIEQIRGVGSGKSIAPARRLVVSAWNPGEIDKIIERTTPPLCHTLFQFYVQDGELSCQLYQRSADLFLGVPFNIASYSLLTMMIAQVTGLKPGDFVHTFGDAHIYNNHIEQVKLQLSRSPFNPPKMKINTDVKNIDDFKLEDFTLEGYEAHPAIKAPVAV